MRSIGHALVTHIHGLVRFGVPAILVTWKLDGQSRVLGEMSSKVTTVGPCDLQDVSDMDLK
jgi:hypothetical protein